MRHEINLTSGDHRKRVNDLELVAGDTETVTLKFETPLEGGTYAACRFFIFGSQSVAHVDNPEGAEVVLNLSALTTPTEREPFQIRLDAADGKAVTVVYGELKIHYAVAESGGVSEQGLLSGPDLMNQIAGKADLAHSHEIADINGLAVALDGKPDIGHTHEQAQVVGLGDALAAKADTGHGHPIVEVLGLQNGLDNKAAAVHGHDADQVAPPAGAAEGTFARWTGGALGQAIGVLSDLAGALTVRHATTAQFLFVSEGGITWRLRSQQNGSFAVRRDNTGDEAIRITSDGDVGVNETNPQAALHVTNDSAGQPAICVQGEPSGTSGLFAAQLSDGTPAVEIDGAGRVTLAHAAEPAHEANKVKLWNENGELWAMNGAGAKVKLV